MCNGIVRDRDKGHGGKRWLVLLVSVAYAVSAGLAEVCRLVKNFVGKKKPSEEGSVKWLMGVSGEADGWLLGCFVNSRGCGCWVESSAKGCVEECRKGEGVEEGCEPEGSCHATCDYPDDEQFEEDGLGVCLHNAAGYCTGLLRVEHGCCEHVVRDDFQQFPWMEPGEQVEELVEGDQEVSEEEPRQRNAKRCLQELV